MKHLLFVLILLLAISCSYDSTAPITPVTPTEVVYAAGFTELPVEVVGFRQQAAYWKNGNMVLLPGGKLQSMANSIIEVGNDLYVAGSIADTVVNTFPKNIATYWKNGIAVSLPLQDGAEANTISEALSVFVLGSDVYVAGYNLTVVGPNYHETIKGMYWKNGVAIPLPTTEMARSIAVLGADVYITGFAGGYWKNGEIISLPGCSNTWGLALSGKDIYVTGANSIDLPTYWKNDTTTVVLLSQFHPYVGTAFGIAVSGQDVYVVGQVSSSNGAAIAGYWKNGDSVPLAESNFAGNFVVSIAMSGTNVYIAGTASYPGKAGLPGEVGPGVNGGLYWKNGTVIPIVSSKGVNSIFVK